MKIKKIALMLVLSISVNIAGSQLAFASENVESKTLSTTQISALEEFDNAGAFNPDKMTKSQKKAYNASIDKQVELMKKKYGKNFDAKKFRTELVKILETENSLKNVQASINIKDSSIRTMSDTWVPDICISNDYVSAAIAVIIDGILVASGVGSVAALVRKIGVAEAKRIFTKSIKSKLKAWGCGAFAASAGTIVSFILEVASPEDAAAEYLDSIDSYPNDGYFDVIL